MKNYEIRKVLKPKNEDDSVVSVPLYEDEVSWKEVCGFGIYVDNPPLPNGIITQRFVAEFKTLSDAEVGLKALWTSWIETHYEVVAAITLQLEENPIGSERIQNRYKAQGTGGMYELAEELTDKFETLNQNREWDGEFFDEIEAFLCEELSKE